MTISSHRRSPREEPDKETARVVQAALDVARLTDGAFDPTVGPLVDVERGFV